jgi:hypothetical protein
MVNFCMVLGIPGLSLGGALDGSTRFLYVLADTLHGVAATDGQGSQRECDGRNDGGEVFFHGGSPEMKSWGKS